jgi:5-methylcytosine-specific restriction endonuclease McrA
VTEINSKDWGDELVAKKRDYKKEYAQYHSKPEQKKNRAKRNAARREMGLKVGDKREVDHKKPLSKGGSNKKSNLRVVSRTTNRKKGNKRK